MKLIITESQLKHIASKATSLSVTEQSVVGAPSNGVSAGFTPASASIPAAAMGPAKNGWWDKQSGLMAYLKDKSQVKIVHYPEVAQKDNGAIAIEKVNGGFWDFFVDGKFYIFETLDNALKGVSQSYSGTWKSSGNNLYIKTSDGESWNNKTKVWAKAAPKIQWVKQSGNFPLKFGEVGGGIGAMQVALGLKGDTYFGPRTEKAILTKTPEYKRLTGVTQEIYNKIVATATAQSQTVAAQPTNAQLQANPSTLNPY